MEKFPQKLKEELVVFLVLLFASFILFATFIGFLERSSRLILYETILESIFWKTAFLVFVGFYCLFLVVYLKDILITWGGNKKEGYALGTGIWLVGVGILWGNPFNWPTTGMISLGLVNESIRILTGGRLALDVLFRFMVFLGCILAGAALVLRYNRLGKEGDKIAKTS